MSWTYRHRKMLVMAAILFGVIVLAAAVVFNLMRQAEQEQEQQQIIADYERQIEQLKTSEEQSQQQVWTVARTVPAGSKIAPEDLKSITLPAAMVSSELLAGKEEIIGKHTKIELQPGMPLLVSMLHEGEPLARDIRMQEFQTIQLPSNLQKAQFIDVRINFPTGEDFVVLAKKQVLERKGTVIWLEMNETDLLLTSSAIIDAYLQGARLYALTYVEPGLQEAAVVNYPANPMVLDLLEHDPNLVEKASTELARKLRETLENNLKDMSEADKLRVMYGNVTVQQQLMNERAATQQSNAAQQTQPVPDIPEPDVHEPVQEDSAYEPPPSSLPSTTTEEEPPPEAPEQQAPPASGAEPEPAQDHSDKLQDIFNQ